MRSLYLCFVLAACSTNIGSSLDGGSGGDGGVPGDLDAGPLPLPREARGIQLTPDGLDANAAVDVGGTLIVTGSRHVTNSNLRDGALVRIGAQSMTAQFTGGMLNDQLYAVASDGSTALAVGITRSFLGGATKDQLLLAFAQPTTQTITIGRLSVPADEAVQPRTITASGGGWIVAGHHLMGARGFIAILNANGTPVRAVSFLVGPTATGLIVRRVLADASRIYVTGFATQNGQGAGFIAAFDASTLAAVWSQRVTAASDLQLMDAALAGDMLRVVGAAGSAGVSLDVKTDTGMVTASSDWPGAELHSVVRDGSSWWIAGRANTTAIAGKLGESELHAVQISNLSLSSLSAQSLVARPDGISLIGSRTSGMVEVPLNATPVGACGGSALGAPLTVLAKSATTTAAPGTIDVRALPLAHSAPSPTTTNATVAPFDACAN